MSLSYKDWQARKDGWTNSREGTLLDKTLEGHGAADRPRTPGHTDRVFGFDPSASRPMAPQARPGGSTMPQHFPVTDDVPVRESGKGNLEPAGTPRPSRFRPF